jgi:HD-GYP domain-containing protein (c-di-GMP phosphodiesterase class II)
MSRWKARPIVGALLRVFSAGSPIVVGYLIASLVGASLHPAGGWVWWLAVLGSAVAAGWLTILLTVRFRLLAMLYELALVFPGRAPDRWDVVKRAKDPIRLRRKLAGSSIGRDQNVDVAAATVLAMAITLPRHDRRSSGHPHRVVDYSDLIARQLRIGDADRERLKWAALSHGIGKLLLDRDLLTTTGEFTPKEQEAWETYPAKGMRLIGPMAAWLGGSAAAVESHAENWDGSGFPDQKSEEQIPLAARVVAVAASLDVLTTGPGAVNHDKARRLIAAASATDFDPVVVRAFMQVPSRSLRAASGLLSRLVPERATAFVGRSGPALALSAAFLVTTAASVGGALLPLPDLTTIDLTAVLDLVISEDEATTTSTSQVSTTTAPAATTSTVGESTTTSLADVTTTSAPRRPTTTTTSPGTTSTAATTTTTTTTIPGTTSTSTSSTTTTTTRPPTTTTSTTTQPPTTTTDTTAPTTTTTDTTAPPTTTTDTTAPSTTTTDTTAP